jgi:hypothetical protein
VGTIVKEKKLAVSNSKYSLILEAKVPKGKNE